MTSDTAVQRMSVADFNSLVREKKNLQIIDVRSPDEFASESLDGSKNIPLPDVQKRIGEISKQVEVFLLCRSGKRATQAAATIAKEGYTVRVIDGGLLAWQQAGLPIKKGASCLPVQRQAQVLIGTAVMICTSLALGGSKIWLAVTGLLGAGMIFTALTGNCALAMLLAKAPWNTQDEQKQPES